MSKKQNPNPKLFPFKECVESDFDCVNCQYEGCDAWGCGFLDDEDLEIILKPQSNESLKSKERSKWT